MRLPLATTLERTCQVPRLGSTRHNSIGSEAQTLLEYHYLATKLGKYPLQRAAMGLLVSSRGLAC